MNKMKSQITIWVIGIISIAFGVWTMVQMPTLILSPWLLAGLYLFVTLIISLGIGALIKMLLKSSWYSITYAALITTGICLTFIVSQYKPNYVVMLPDNYSGEVILLLSNESDNDFKVNDFGIGYISPETYKGGFRPKVLQRGQDISGEITGYSTGSYVTSANSSLSFRYMSFQTPKAKGVSVGLDSLLKTKAIDIKRLKKE